MDCLPLNQHRDIEGMLTNLEKVKVLICFDNYGIIGQTYYQAEQRFLDMLNKDFVIDKQRSKDFLIVTQSLLMGLDGEKEQIASPCFVNKHSIIFIGTFDETTSTTSENINTIKAYPWREKNIVPVKMVLAGKYRIVGQIHGDPKALPVHYIESQNEFLPMTNAKVISPLVPSEISFNFAAVNRNHISLFQLSQLTTT
ncbi:hypothetical protein ACFLWU_03385 [Chloroflexota bacterium]